MDSLFEALDGPLREAYQAVDWATTPLGPVSDWSETLVNAANLTLSSRFPITLLWGPEAVLVYNEAYVPLIGDKHPAALGWPAREVFPEAWEIIRPMVRTVLAGRGATWFEDRYVPLRRRGFLEECYFTFSYSPVRGRDGAVEGVMAVAAETTEEVLSRRRLRLLTQLRERLADVEQYEDIPRSALPLLRSTREDFPAVDIRLRGEPGDDGLGSPRGPGESSGHGGEMVEARGDGRVASFPCTSPTSSVQGTLVVSLSPRLAPDDHYLGFLRLVAESLRQALDRVRTRSAERRVLVAQRHMSEAFQRHLLPRPEGSGYPAVAVRYQPAAEVADIGGDWYDLFELPDESLMVVIGDVAGHDQDAAAAMASVRNMSRGIAYTIRTAAPGRVLEALDRALHGTTRDIVATVVMAHVDRNGSSGPTLTWSNAGHPPPVLIEPEGTARLMETTPDLLLGVDERTSRTDHRIDLRPGATVVFYTDGLIERRGVSFSDGLAWLSDLLQGQQHLDVEKLSDFVLQNAAGTEDDMALLVLRV